MDRLLRRVSRGSWPGLGSRITATLTLVAALATAFVLPDYKEAISLFKRQRYREALEAVRPDVNRHPDWEFGHRLVGLCYLNLREYPAAVRAFSRAIELRSTEASVYLGLAEAQYQLDKPELALDALRQGAAHLKTRRDRFTSQRIRAHALFALGRFGEAAEAMQAAFQLESGQAEDWQLLGISYFQLGQDNPARQALNKALEMQPGLGLAREHLSRLEAREGEEALRARRYDRAQEVFRRILDARPADRAAQFNLAQAAIGLGQWDEAERLLAPLEGTYATSYRYHFFVGYVRERQGRDEEALRSYNRAAALDRTVEVQTALQRVRARTTR